MIIPSTAVVWKPVKQIMFIGKEFSFFEKFEKSSEVIWLATVKFRRTWGELKLEIS